MKPELTQEFLKNIIHYNDETGSFVWLKRPREMFNCDRSWNRWNNKYCAKEAGASTSDGYLAISINNTKYKAHRLAFLYFHGYMPKYIDHIDQDKTNNRISNLRGVTHKENLMNMRKKKNNTSGVTGVYWRSDIDKWAAQIMVDGRCVPLGTHTDKFEAICARKSAEKRYGFHENHGK